MGNCPKHAQNLKKKRKGKERLKPWGTPGGEIRHHVVTTASLYHTCHQRPLLKLSCPTECWSLAKSGVMEGPRMHSWVRSAPVRLDCLAGSSWPRDSVRPFPAGALLHYRVWVQTHLPICIPAHLHTDPLPLPSCMLSIRSQACSVSLPIRWQLNLFQNIL